jgi:hypothetical protein
MELLFVKAGYVRDFITFIRSKGTDNEKHDVEWLNTSIKTRVAMAITPFHRNTVADLGVVVQPSRSKDFPSQFASLESLSEFKRTYKGYENGESIYVTIFYLLRLMVFTRQQNVTSGSETLGSGAAGEWWVHFQRL